MTEDYSIRLVRLDVGQGVGTFLEVYDQNSMTPTAPRFTAVFDMGSDHDVATAGQNAVDYVVGRLKRMENPTLDAVVFSHSDLDHISLMQKILDEFAPYSPGKTTTKPQLQVKYVLFGGNFSIYRKKKGRGKARNILVDIKQYMKNNTDDDPKTPSSITNAYSSFDETPVEPYRSIGPVQLHLMVANFPDGDVVAPAKGKKRKRQTTDAFSINTMSVISVLGYGHIQMIESGDATGLTLLRANQVFARHGSKIDNYINDVQSMTVPHHGSIRTLTNLGTASSTSGVTVAGNITEALGNFKAQSFTVSAAERNSHDHPSAEVLNWFAATTDNGAFYKDSKNGIAPYHFYTAYFRAGAFERESFIDDDEVEKWPDDWGMTPGHFTRKKSRWGNTRTIWVEPEPIEAEPLTVRMQKPVYSSVYYSAGHADIFTALPPNPGRILEPFFPAVGSTPDLGVNWVYTTDQIGDLESRTRLAPETNRPAPGSGAPGRHSAAAVLPEVPVAPAPVPAGRAVQPRVPVRRPGAARPTGLEVPPAVQDAAWPGAAGPGGRGGRLSGLRSVR